MLKGYPLFIVSFLLFIGTLIVGLFHLKERGSLYYLVLSLTGAFFLYGVGSFLVEAFKSLLEDYRKHRSILSFLYDFFASLKLAIFLMIALGLLSMLGSTYIQQGQPFEFYINRYGKELGLWFWKLWLTDVFHSWYYILFLVLLALNLIVCSIKRLPPIWRQTFSPERFQKLDERMEKHLKALSFRVYPSEEKIVNLLHRLGFRVFVQKEGDRTYLYGEKGKYSRLGVYVVHIGLLVIMAGALVDALFGVRGSLVVAEGSSSNSLVIPSKGKTLDLPFRVELEKFHIVTYEEEAQRQGKKVDPRIKDNIASFESRIRIIDGGRVVKEGLVAVNHPITYKGYRIYQATYGLTGEVGRAKLAVFDSKILREEKNPQKAFLGEVELVAGKVSEYRNMLIAIDRSVLNLENPQSQELKPALMLKVLMDGKSYDVPVIYNPQLTAIAYAQLGLRDFPYFFIMLDAEPRYFSGFQVSRYPGTWLIWLGSILVVGGMLLAFYTVHRKVWMRLEGSTLVVAFWSHKFKEEFRKQFIKALEEVHVKDEGVVG
ncbi:cytochrome c biogenesis protein ResB [Thermocrinis minervae]|uniref:Cytochrome c biogenesis protein n=1 Tax=Thermocrinis minervae TaxID=381751 RepID=A0A1M6TH88_9AQUI|nr:cytochrome c biogenesis protein ResB [Thermocrinis minervae]SHK56283.1 cytochrome c biogenesis protein [Thermocrinis minervae]